MRNTHATTPWREAGIICLGDLYDEHRLRPFQALQEVWELGAGAFLTYNALVRCIRNTWGAGQDEPRLHTGFQCILTHGKGKRAVTVLYGALQELDDKQAPHSSLKWEMALGVDLSIKQWQMAMEQTRRVSRNALLKFT